MLANLFFILLMYLTCWPINKKKLSDENLDGHTLLYMHMSKAKDIEVNLIFLFIWLQLTLIYVVTQSHKSNSSFIS